MVWDLAYDGCNYLAQTNCGERPICDECNQGCWDITTDHPTEEVDCGHDLGILPTPITHSGCHHFTMATRSHIF